MNLKRKMRKGFTLVELVVVIAVIAVLAAVSVGAYFGVTDSANSSNATAAYKQIKDLWVMYSVDEYNSNWSAERNAKEFCLKYVEDYGPDYYVNYTKVSIDATETEASNAHGRNDANSEAILFKIETNYPTWFIVSDELIVEEGTPSKTEEDFKTSLTNSIRLSDDSISKVTSEDFAFDIETIKIDPVTGRKVRGFRFYNITLNYENGTEKDNFSIKPGESIYSEKRGYAIGEVNTSTDGNGSTFIGYSFGIFDGNREIYSTDPITLEEDLENATKIQSYEEELAYGYHVANKTYIYKDYQNGTSQIEYPFILAKASNYSSTPSETIVTGVLSNKKNEIYYASSIELTYISNDNYLSTDAFNELSKNDSNYTYFVFINTNNAIISRNITIGKNIVLVVGHYDLNGMKDLVGKSSTKNVYSEKSWGIWSVKETNYTVFSDNFYDLKPNISNTSNNSQITEGVPNPNYRDKFLAGDTYIKNKLTITETGVLNIMPGGYLLADGIIHLPTAGTVFQISDRGEIENNGVINLGLGEAGDVAKMRSFSKITGNGSINARCDSEIFDIIKFDDFFGGTHATNSLVNLKIFPYNDYVFDNIQCDVILETGAKYVVKTGMFMSNYNFITDEINLFSSGNDKAFFILGENSKIMKSFKGDNRSVFTILKGQLDDAYFSSKLNIDNEDSSGIGSIIGGLVGALNNITIDNTSSNFPLSNIDFIINDGCELLLNSDRSKGAYELLPSYSIEIKEGGKLRIENKATLAIFSSSDFKNIMDTITNDDDDIYSDMDRELFRKFATEETNGKVSVKNNGEIIINNGNVFINKDAVNELENNEKINVYNLIVSANLIDMSNSISGDYIYRYMIGDHAKEKGYEKTITIYKYNPNKYTN